MPSAVAKRPARASTSGDVTTELPQHHMVLLAFARASGWSTKRVPYEELVLQAWRDFPKTFGLRNHQDKHPDASDIHKRLYQNLKKDGHIVSLGNKIFRLTEKGLAAARDLQARLDGKTVAPSSDSIGRDLLREEDMLLTQAANSRVFATWQAGGQEKLIDYDAGVFFGFTTATKVGDRRIRTDQAMQVFRKAQSLGDSRGAGLLALGEFLTGRFAHLYQEKK